MNFIKCQKCGLEISSRNAVEKQFYELAHDGEIKDLSGEFPYKCIHCEAIIMIKFEMQPYFYINAK